ncbi:hypothetical protein TM1040_0379 [Ruegeria sp. TM1040]|nr:hypothetical protein TM1040_0379 [Ruegeria sp. TM1040]
MGLDILCLVCLRLGNLPRRRHISAIFVLCIGFGQAHADDQNHQCTCFNMLDHIGILWRQGQHSPLTPAGLTCSLHAKYEAVHIRRKKLRPSLGPDHRACDKLGLELASPAPLGLAQDLQASKTNPSVASLRKFGI